MTIEHLTALDAETDKVLRAQSAIALRQIRKTKKPAAHWLMQRDEAGEIRAGCRAALWQGWMTIDALWVQPSERGKGLGSQLLIQLEEVARAEGASGLEAMIYALQSADFFVKRGFSPLARLPGIDSESERLWLVKSFSPLPAPQIVNASPDPRRIKRETRKSGTTTRRKKGA